MKQSRARRVAAIGLSIALVVVGPFPPVVAGASLLPQSISFAVLPDTLAGQAPIALQATASSGLAVGYSVAGTCEVSGATLTVTAVGTCSVTATQAGDSTWAAAARVTRSFSVRSLGAVAVSAGATHACALMSDQSVRCWGGNGSGELGDGTTYDRSYAFPVGGLSAAAAVSVGLYHSCALLAGGGVDCWGDNEWGELGVGSSAPLSAVPATVPGISDAISVSAGGSATCAVLADATIRCWGDDSHGQLGGGSGSAVPPVVVSGIDDAAAVSVGDEHACALLAGGNVACWGDDSFGELGDGSTIWSAAPVAVSGISGAVAISAGVGFTCAVLSSGAVDCWGADGRGELGSGTLTNSLVPVAVPGIANAVAVSAGLDHACAILADGSARCWGANDFGQLGAGPTAATGGPTTVPGLSVSTITAGGSSTCAVLIDYSARCWGDNSSGQLGDDTTTDRSSPVPVSGIPPHQTIAFDPLPDSVSGDAPFTLGAAAASLLPVIYSASGDCTASGSTLTLTGEGRCTVTASQTGDPTWDPASDTAQSFTVASPSMAPVGVSSGDAHACVVLANGTVRCWGDNYWGELGDGTNTSRSAAEPVPGIDDAVAVAAGGWMTCALHRGGTVSCWGHQAGVAGDDTTTPMAVPGITTAMAISAGVQHTCALLADGTIRCWGGNGRGELGDGTTTFRYVPVAVVGISTAVVIAAGFDDTCALLADGTIRCWGDNMYGQLGNGTTTDSSVPVAVSGVGTAIAVAIGQSQTCAVLADGTVSCWGAYYGPTIPWGSDPSATPVPVPVPGLAGVTSISVGLQSCARLEDGSVTCWHDLSGLDPVAVSAAEDVSISWGFGCALLVGGYVHCWNGAPGDLSTSHGFGDVIRLLVGVQSIDFPAIADVTYGTPPITLTASASSGLPVSYSVTGSCSASGSTLMLTGVGTCSVMASQPGDGLWAPAASVTQSFNISSGSSGCSITLSLDATADTAAILGYAEGPFESSLAPGCSTTTTAASPDQAISDLESGSVQAALVSRPLSSAESSSLYGWQIASDGMVLAVQDSDSMSFLSNITSAQVQAIYSGSIRDWDQLGGPDQLILVGSAAIGSDERADLLRIFGISDEAEQATVAAGSQPRFASPAEAAADAKANPYEIVYTSVYEAQADGSGLKVLSLDGVTPSVSSVQNGTYPAIRTFYLVMRQDELSSSAATNSSITKAQDLVNFMLTAAGQQAVAEANFVTVNIPPTQPIPDVDVNLDGAIGLADIGGVTAHWGQSSACPGWIRADVNNDGAVGLADLGKVTARWGRAGFLTPLPPTPPPVPTPTPTPKTTPTLAPTPTPTPTPTSTAATSPDFPQPTMIAAGDDHTCALLADGTVRRWGYNYFGGLGDGTATDSSIPIAVYGIQRPAALSVVASPGQTVTVVTWSAPSDDGAARSAATR